MKRVIRMIGKRSSEMNQWKNATRRKTLKLSKSQLEKWSLSENVKQLWGRCVTVTWQKAMMKPFQSRIRLCFYENMNEWAIIPQLWCWWSFSKVDHKETGDLLASRVHEGKCEDVNKNVTRTEKKQSCEITSVNELRVSSVGMWGSVHKHTHEEVSAFNRRVPCPKSLVQAQSSPKSPKVKAKGTGL